MPVPPTPLQRPRTDRRTVRRWLCPVLAWLLVAAGLISGVASDGGRRAWLPVGPDDACHDQTAPCDHDRAHAVDCSIHCAQFVAILPTLDLIAEVGPDRPTARWIDATERLTAGPEPPPPRRPLPR